MAGIRKKDTELMTRILQFINCYYFEYHQSPTLQTIADGVGVAKTTVYRYLVEMNKNGTLQYNGINIETESMRKNNLEMNRAPVLGGIACGIPDAAEENFEEFIALPVALFGKGDFFILNTYGDSMIEKGIDHGDKVIIKRQNHASRGDVVVALVDNETTLKTYYPEPNKNYIRLHPENPTMSDIITQNCIIQGVAKYVIKKL